jgi:hypothetical protein
LRLLEYDITNRRVCQELFGFLATFFSVFSLTIAGRCAIIDLYFTEVLYGNAY